MSTSPTIAPSVAFTRAPFGSLGYASWPTTVAQGCNGHMSVNHGDTTGTTGSKRLTPGHLLGALT